jgi:hypothetical protein
VSEKESIVAIKETNNKKSKRYSKKSKVGMQESCSESDTEIAFENGDCGDNISDGDAMYLFYTWFFSYVKTGEKWAKCVRCYCWAHEDCGVEGLICVPHVHKNVKL